MTTTKTGMLAPKNVRQVCRIAEAAARELDVQTISIYITSGGLFGAGTYGNSYFVDSEDGELHLYLFRDEE